MLNSSDHSEKGIHWFDHRWRWSGSEAKLFGQELWITNIICELSVVLSERVGLVPVQDAAEVGGFQRHFVSFLIDGANRQFLSQSHDGLHQQTICSHGAHTYSTQTINHDHIGGWS